jgi:sugar phosphate isomerase/epimerase
MLGAGDLVLSSGAVGNPPVPELVEAALAGGYRGLDLWPGAYLARTAAAADLAEMRGRFRDAGLVLQNLDAVIVWAGPDDPGPPYYEEAVEHEVYRMADALGARGVNVLLQARTRLSEEAAAEAFAGVCDRAAAHGLAAHLEFSRARTPADIPAAARVIARAGRANAGLMVDAWHVHWGASDFSDLRELPGACVTGVQLCDAPADEPVDFAAATRHQRLLPGTGVADLGEMLAALEAIGSRAPLCIESFDSERVAAVGPVAYAREMADAARLVLAAR